MSETPAINNGRNWQGDGAFASSKFLFVRKLLENFVFVGKFPSIVQNLGLKVAILERLRIKIEIVNTHNFLCRKSVATCWNSVGNLRLSENLNFVPCLIFLNPRCCCLQPVTVHVGVSISMVFGFIVLFHFGFYRQQKMRGKIYFRELFIVCHDYMQSHFSQV